MASMKHTASAIVLRCSISASLLFLGCAAERGGPAAPTTNSGIFYTAIGASDSVGLGSSSPCTTQSCPNGTGWVPVLARRLEATLVNLAISGATIGPDTQALGIRYGRNVPANYLDQELPLVPSNSTLITVFAGANDTLAVLAAAQGGAGGPDTRAFIDSQIQVFRRDFDRLINGIRDRAPRAKIVVANLPNVASTPMVQATPRETQQILQRLSVGFATEAMNKYASEGVLVIDFLCNSRILNPSFYSSDGFHGNDTGYAFIANEVFNAINQPNAPVPQASCPEMTVVPPL
jgi:lysophospholipase L1-like esterase